MISILNTQKLYIKQYLNNPLYTYIYKNDSHTYLLQAITDSVVEEPLTNIYICEFILTLETKIKYTILIEKVFDIYDNHIGWNIFDQYYLYDESLSSILTEDSNILINSQNSDSIYLITQDGNLSLSESSDNLTLFESIVSEFVLTDSSGNLSQSEDSDNLVLSDEIPL
jgi:hypothetical protein